MKKVNQELVCELSGYLQTAQQIVIGLLNCIETSGVATNALLKASSIPHVRQSEALSVISVLVQFEVIRNDNESWTCLYSSQEIQVLSNVLIGANIYKSLSDEVIHRERPEIVLTRPRAPSRLDKAISDDTSLSVNIEDTHDAFSSLAASAKERLTIMTPFLDEVGANWALSLFKVAKNSISKELILRFLQDPNSDLYPDGLPGILSELGKLDVKVFDFAVPRPDTPNFFETFHAKVISADGERAYVGSANLSKHSKETSMELGMLVSGTAALRVESILTKIRGIAISF